MTKKECLKMKKIIKMVAVALALVLLLGLLPR